jgi:hypothetical protein
MTGATLLLSFRENVGMNHFKCNNLLIAVHVSLIKQYTRCATNKFADVPKIASPAQ